MENNYLDHYVPAYGDNLDPGPSISDLPGTSNNDRPVPSSYTAVDGEDVSIKIIIVK